MRSIRPGVLKDSVFGTDGSVWEGPGQNVSVSMVEGMVYLDTV